MKRSDFINQITLNILSQAEPEEFVGRLDLLYAVDFILSEAEKLGMRPPHPDGDLAVFLEDGEWEAENGHES